MSAEARLKEKNITLPKPATPMANYVGAVRVGNLLFVSGHGPVRDGKATMRGKLGKDLSVEVFGEGIGKHARSAVGMAELPVGIPVEIEMILEVE